tara:strand:+ start:36807 stop:37184 length:378 start_codon:yes stop_codon:yes gene_type:complete
MKWMSDTYLPQIMWSGSIRASYDDHRASKRIIHSSICSDQYSNTHITPSDNGFVRALFSAYSSHHHLTIRPEDVWFAMLSQINFYINAHAEELRDHFVSHEGKKSSSVRTLEPSVHMTLASSHAA